MQIQVNTDANIRGRITLAERVSAEVEAALSNYAEYITRVDVHLGDENSHKAGADDKRCMISANIAGQKPAAVTHHAATLDLAVQGAAEKLQRSLEGMLARYKDHTDRSTIRKDVEL
ncbi:MAG: HPF/RaiA family ribosome-associated protein [Pseudomonadota bacterium]